MTGSETSTAPTRESVTVVTIDHRHGTTVTAHRTEQGAERALHDHATTWWHELADDPGPIPDEPSAAIEEYFARHPSDFRTTEVVELLD
ncbi:hypothetical protein O4328_28740 [Rhodococcus opacus]|uniref:ASCH domain-containing protein n=1 Tax=Rhodococcus opacus TaxID=37919 RepID=A0AAX3YSM6_RHOOP|nr:hypothetical protein [Rhodococcus opacus]MCZ4587628.1 hypothetical protein [Rhodococcus opacus]WLF51376.1 hypothetical protein Q5707_37520 [Rhodococcus opacus]